MLQNYGANKDELQDLLLFHSSTKEKLTTLSEYTSRMPESQKYIYYAAGASLTAIDSLPQTELVKANHMEILYFTEQADEFLTEALRTYGEKPFRSVLNDDLGLENKEAEESGESDHSAVLELNASHSAFKALEAALDAGDKDKAADYVRIFFAQAQLIAGLPLENPSEYADLVCKLMK